MLVISRSFDLRKKTCIFYVNGVICHDDQIYIVKMGSSFNLSTIRYESFQ
jgi:hypothetical protein